MNFILELEKLQKQRRNLQDEAAKFQILHEERLEAALLVAIRDAKERMLSEFDNRFAANYQRQKSQFVDATAFLLDHKLERREKTLQVRFCGDQIFYFSRTTIPKPINDWLQKQGGNVPANIIELISEVNPDPFSEALISSVFSGYEMGGQSVFAMFDLKLDFSIRDENVQNYLRNQEITLAQAVTQQVETAVKFELLDGVRNGESVPEIRKRIVNAWDKPINVNVPPKIGPDGGVVRQGYSYALSAEDWATAVARTEIAKAVIEGKLEGYEQTGVVDRVEVVITPDERLCPACSLLEGEQFKLEDAHGIVPVHASCRCTMIPVIDNIDSVLSQARANVADLYGVVLAA